MHSREDKLRAVGLFIKYDFSPQSAINELGYPCRGSLYSWYEEHLANDGAFPARTRIDATETSGGASPRSRCFGCRGNTRRNGSRGHAP